MSDTGPTAGATTQRIPDEALASLLDQVRGFAAADPAPDPMELTRMWLITTAVPDTDEPAGPLYLTEVHGSSRLLLTADGRAFLTPPDRQLIGFGFAIPAVALPSPNELEDWLVAQLEAAARGEQQLGRSDRWRLQRLANQLPKAARTTAQWAAFVLRNDVSYLPTTDFGVWLADGRRLGVTVTAATGDAVELGNADGFWDHNAFTRFGEALCAT
jgi:hypothetical protein